MIGFTSVSLRSYSIADVVNIAKNAGAEIIEWGSDFHVKNIEDAELAKKLCDENEILINSYGTYYRTGSMDKDEWKKICICASIMGAKYVRTWLGTKGSAETDEKEYQNLLEDIKCMADVASEYGLTISHECHHHTYNDTTESSLRFIEDAGKTNLKTYYQSWYRDEDGDRDKLLKTFPYVQDVHISFSELDNFQKGYKKDKKYIEKILQWLKELNFNNCLIIEFTKHNNDEDLIADIDKLKKLWKK